MLILACLRRGSSAASSDCSVPGDRRRRRTRTRRRRRADPHQAAQGEGDGRRSRTCRSGVLKEFAAQVEMKAERPVMWTYAPASRSDKRSPTRARTSRWTRRSTSCSQGGVASGTSSCRRTTTSTTAGCGYDQGSERGYASRGGAVRHRRRRRDEGGRAARRWPKKLIEDGKTAAAKPVLELVVTKYPAHEGRRPRRRPLLEKMNK